MTHSPFEFRHPPGYDSAGGLRILMAPWNFADQPMALTRAMRERGHFVHQLQYMPAGGQPMGYDVDAVLRLSYGDLSRQFEALQQCLDQQFQIYHFWQRSLVFRPDLSGLTGIDLPLLKALGLKIFHRFTGFDLRLPTQDKALNPYSPYNRGYEAPFDEARQQHYIEHLRRYVDRCIVQDPEMHQFMPDATIVPRGLDLSQWEPVGVTPNDRPLIVHAPSSPMVKGSAPILKAIDELGDEGLSFEYKQLDQLPYDEARTWYERADIVIDQILIGATGVLTLEAWALAKPCVTYLREDLFEPFYGTSELPVANANPDNVKDVLRRLIKDFDWRADLARRGRETVEQFHDMRKVSERYEALCRDTLAGADVPATTAEDIRFVAAGLRWAPRPAEQLSTTGLAERFPRTVHLVALFFSAQERFFAAFVRGQIVVLRGCANAILGLFRRGRDGGAEKPQATGKDD